jgi:hypothetical protein
LALKEHQALTERLAATEQGVYRAHDELMEAYRVRDAAERDMTEARKNNPGELVASYLEGRPTPQASLRLAEAQTEVKRAASHVGHMEEIEAALQQEISILKPQLRLSEMRMYSALGNAVADSESFQLLCANMSEAWKRLRTLRTVAANVQKACKGYLPHECDVGLLASEPLEERVGYPVDNAVVATWQTALDDLLEDADTELPNDGE